MALRSSPSLNNTRALVGNTGHLTSMDPAVIQRLDTSMAIGGYVATGGSPGTGHPVVFGGNMDRECPHRPWLW